MWRSASRCASGSTNPTRNWYASGPARSSRSGMARPAAEIRAPGPRELLHLLAPFPGRAAMAARIALICAVTVLVASVYGMPEAALSAYVVVLPEPRRPRHQQPAGRRADADRDHRDRAGARRGDPQHRLRDPAGGLHGGAVGRPALPDLGQQAARGRRDPGDDRRFRARRARPRAVRRGRHARVALCLADGRDSGRRVDRHQPAGGTLAAPARARPAGPAAAARRAAAAGRRGGPRRLRRRPARRRQTAAHLAQAVEAGRLDLRRRGRPAPAGDRVEHRAAGDGRAGRSRARGALARGAVRDPRRHTRRDGRHPRASGYPVEVTLAPPPADALPPLARSVATELHAVIMQFAEPAAPASPPPAAETAPPPKPGGGFFLPDARSNPDHIRYALKTTAAAMFCYLLYSQLDWSGIHTCFITCYMVSLGSIAETVEKLTLRIAGCLIGALLGTAALVFVVPALSSIEQLLALVLVGAWLSAWVAFGSPRIAYAGFVSVV
ncbi:MAG: FUSC family protein [Burkholderia sp.]